MPAMKAQKLCHRRQTYRNGLIEMVIWRLPQTDAERPHGLKYRLVYVRNHERLIGYDNERGKGDHKHLAGCEDPTLRRCTRAIARFLVRRPEIRR
jgi:hypothetical protein